MRSAEDFEAVLRLLATGMNDCAIARRYHVSNRSDDICGLFTAALDAPGIPWTRPSKYVIAVYRNAAVARLDEFVGPKS